MSAYGTLYDQMRRTRYRSGVDAVKAQEKVGALGASNKGLKVWSSDQDIDAPSKTYPDPDGKPSEAGNLERGNPGVKGGDADYGQNPDGSIREQPSASDQLKIHEQSTKTGKSFGSLQDGLSAASSILNTLDMLTGGQDKMLPGSGHTYSPRQDSSMYIGQGMGY